MIIGVSAAINPIIYEESYNFDISLLLIISVMFAIFPFVGVKDKMTRLEGSIFFIAYICYMTLLVVA